jgi:hypothetical protein
MTTTNNQLKHPLADEQAPAPFSFDVEGSGLDQGAVNREVGEAQPGEEQDGNE